MASVEQFAQTKRKAVAKCNGGALAVAIEAAQKILGGIGRTEIVLQLNSNKGRIEVVGESGAARFHTVFKAETRDKATIMLSLEEAIRAVPLLGQQEQILLSQGQGVETFLSFKDGWLLYAGWKG